MRALRLGMAGAQEGEFAGPVPALFQPKLEQNPGESGHERATMPLPVLRVGLDRCKKQGPARAMSALQSL
jgi:hypothetical protein